MVAVAPVEVFDELAPDEMARVGIQKRAVDVCSSLCSYRPELL